MNLEDTGQRQNDQETASEALITLAPKPVIVNVLGRWRVPPGMVFAVAEDVEGNLWILESTPVGTHSWTLEQAASLPLGRRTRRALQEALKLGLRLQGQRAVEPSVAEDLRLPQRLPALPGPSGSGNLQEEPGRIRRRNAKESVRV